MIISHKHKFIFIKTQKTAGSSIKVALAEFCDDNDIISPMGKEDSSLKKEIGYRGCQNEYLPFKKYWKRDWFNYLYYQNKYRFNDHTSASEIRLRFKNEWSDYFKFAFERNPYDKFISWYYWCGGDKKYKTMKNFIKSGDAAKIKGFELYSEHSEIIVNKVYKFEELNKSLEDITDRLELKKPINLPEKKLKGAVRKIKQPYNDVLSEFEIEWISKVHAREIAYFNYKF